MALNEPVYHPTLLLPVYNSADVLPAYYDGTGCSVPCVGCAPAYAGADATPDLFEVEVSGVTICGGGAIFPDVNGTHELERATAGDGSFSCATLGRENCTWVKLVLIEATGNVLRYVLQYTSGGVWRFFIAIDCPPFSSSSWFYDELDPATFLCAGGTFTNDYSDCTLRLGHSGTAVATPMAGP